MQRRLPPCLPSYLQPPRPAWVCTAPSLEATLAPKKMECTQLPTNGIDSTRAKTLGIGRYLRTRPPRTRAQRNPTQCTRSLARYGREPASKPQPRLHPEAPFPHRMSEAERSPTASNRPVQSTLSVWSVRDGLLRYSSPAEDGLAPDVGWASRSQILLNEPPPNNSRTGKMRIMVERMKLGPGRQGEADMSLTDQSGCARPWR
ncbi:hypothetical protein PMIN01_11500 [Paraphaeosphaeria minitans]|uniref:Uncharacterized protein n=1 Tax=Paraphaeosphaeria minitans TaxID=565426 RepID=A0A9P6KLG6_9PLEO|nr:hypothetical protein PMIN01_11500 [Paraphaeosphaeria minitans]